MGLDDQLAAYMSNPTAQQMPVQKYESSGSLPWMIDKNAYGSPKTKNYYLRQQY